MSLELLETTSSAAVGAARLQAPAIAGLLYDLLAPTPADASVGYAFEAALCQIESQSPAARPAAAGRAPHPAATLAQREAAALAERTRQLARLLADVGRHLDADDARVLYATAAQVAGELIAAFGPGAAAVAADVALTPAERTAAVVAATEARLLAETIAIICDRLHPARGRAGARRLS
jgi:hypothetical protein